jgi:multiple sugar transport system ATP-binding protein
MASVEFEHVSKIYPGGTRAIHDVNLNIADGELVVFVGPSGCGKSTLLRLLAGLETISEGIVRIGGQPVNQLTPQQRNIAMVFQDYALYPYLSVRGNLEFPLKMRKLPRAEIERRVIWVAGLLGLNELLERLPKQLSGGQRQRVAMGRALVREPSVSLLDEPLSNLDAKLRVQVRAEIGELQARMRTTMIYVTHDQVEAMTLGQRVAVLDHGRLQQVASPRDLYEQPVNAFVAGFIGNPPMNLFPVQLTGNPGAGWQLRLGGQTLPLPAVQIAAEPLATCADQPLTGGVRPEALTLASDSMTGFAATVSTVEFLGYETLLYVRVAMEGVGDGQPLVARLPGRQAFQRGESVQLHIADGQLYLFDIAGRVIAYRSLNS